MTLAGINQDTPVYEEKKIGGEKKKKRILRKKKASKGGISMNSVDDFNTPNV